MVALIDPADAKNNEIRGKWIKRANEIWSTHHHLDHCAGNKTLKKLANDSVKVWGADKRIVGLDEFIAHDQKRSFGNLDLSITLTPGHTIGAACFHVMDRETNNSILFTGDTLFSGGVSHSFATIIEFYRSSVAGCLKEVPSSSMIL